MKELLQKICMAVIGFAIVYVLFRVLRFLFPILVIGGLFYYFFVYKKEEAKEVKWYEGTKSDSYYQKEKISEHDVIDVEVKVKRQDDTADR